MSLIPNFYLCFLGSTTKTERGKEIETVKEIERGVIVIETETGRETEIEKEQINSRSLKRGLKNLTLKSLWRR